jgi:hypothetical protein
VPAGKIGFEIMRIFLLVAGLGAGMASGTWAATLSGIVQDVTGHPIGHALVIVRSAHSGYEVGKSLTSGSGAYSFSSLPTGDFNINILASGFKTTTVRDVHLIDQEKSMRPVILEVSGECGSIPASQYVRELEGADSTGRISGTIADHRSNKPIAKADIKLICENNLTQRRNVLGPHSTIRLL